MYSWSQTSTPQNSETREYRDVKFFKENKRPNNVETMEIYDEENEFWVLPSSCRQAAQGS